MSRPFRRIIRSGRCRDEGRRDHRLGKKCSRIDSTRRSSPRSAAGLKGRPGAVSRVLRLRLHRRDRDAAREKAQRLGQAQRLDQPGAVRAPWCAFGQLAERPGERSDRPWSARRRRGIDDDHVNLSGEGSEQVESAGHLDGEDSQWQARPQAIHGNPAELVVAVRTAEAT